MKKLVLAVLFAVLSPSLAIAQRSEQLPVHAITAPAATSVATLLQNRRQTVETDLSFPFPELNGKRLTAPDSSAVYLMMDGCRRLIPDADTYNNLFIDWNNIYVEPLLSIICEGLPLTRGAFLIATDAGRVYLFTDGLKYHIKNPAAATKYYFALSKARAWTQEQADAIPNGFDLD